MSSFGLCVNDNEYGCVNSECYIINIYAIPVQTCVYKINLQSVILIEEPHDVLFLVHVLTIKTS